MLNSDRPRIKLVFTLTDKLLEIIGWSALVVMWMLVVFNYSKLSDNIPIHYNIAGQVDGYGAKSMIFGLLFIGSILYVGMAVLNRFPYNFNYPTQITEENALQQYTIATRMLRYLNVSIVLFLDFLVFRTIQISTGEALGLGVWFLPLFLGSLFVIVGYFIARLIVKR